MQKDSCCNHTHDASTGYISITRAAYLGWADALRIANAAAEVTVVPSIGRIVDFRLTGDEHGPFWLNPELLGKPAVPGSSEWRNFGGDKTWPSPQSAWEAVTGSAWPPPAAFDSLPLAVEVEDATVILTSPVDGHYGIETVRRLELDPMLPVLRVRTEFRKKKFAPERVAIWVITQLRDPIKAFVLLPEKTALDDGYKHEAGITPKGLKIDGRLLSLERDKKASAKIGTEGTALAWIGEYHAFKIETEAATGDFNFPLCQSEIYTNPDPLPYIEMETQGPISNLGIGDTLSKTNAYTLSRRSEKDPVAEAKKLFGI